MKVHEIECKSPLNLANKNMPFKWELNVYRGCSHKCAYCYARYSHEYLAGDFFNDIYVKKNIVEKLEKVLSSSKWKRDVINIGNVCDSYQHIEEKYKLMPEILKLLIRYKTPIVLPTKSKLVLRDIDLIDELSKVAFTNINLSINSCDDSISKIVEPRASTVSERFHVIQELKNTNAIVGVYMMPILPFITDSANQIDEFFRSVSLSGADYVVSDMLNLRGSTKPYYINFIKENFPNLEEKYINLYKNGSIDKDYKTKIAILVKNSAKKYGVPLNYNDIIKIKLSEFSYENGEQLTLF